MDIGSSLNPGVDIGQVCLLHHIALFKSRSPSNYGIIGFTDLASLGPLQLDFFCSKPLNNMFFSAFSTSLLVARILFSGNHPQDTQYSQNRSTQTAQHHTILYTRTELQYTGKT